MNKPLDEAAAKEAYLKYTEQSFTFTSRKKIIDLSWLFAKNIQTQLAMLEEYIFYVNLIMHTSDTLGRISRNNTLAVSEKEPGRSVQEPIYSVIVAPIEIMEETLNIDVPAKETCFITQLVKNAQCTEDKITEIDTLD